MNQKTQLMDVPTAIQQMCQDGTLRNQLEIQVVEAKSGDDKIHFSALFINPTGYKDGKTINQIEICYRAGEDVKLIIITLGRESTVPGKIVVTLLGENKMPKKVNAVDPQAEAVAKMIMSYLPEEVADHLQSPASMVTHTGQPIIYDDE